MFCKNCGKEINDNAVICPSCGCATGQAGHIVKADDASSIGYALLGFFVPLVGLILYLMWKTEYPLRAKSAGKGALISVIVSVVFWLFYILFLVVLVGELVMVGIPPVL